MMGLWLAILTAQELYWLDVKHDNGVVPLSLTCFGLYGCILSLLGDKTHFMNRDDPLWTYVNIGGAGMLVIVACVFTLEWLKKGCKMKSCCGCCDPDEPDSD